MTLVEVLLAIAILGVSVLVIVGGMMTSIKVSAQGRTGSEVQIQMRAYAEAISAVAYADCATTYTATGYTPPTGYSVAVAVSYWTVAGASGSFGGTCGTDSGIQRLTLTVIGPDSTQETLKIVKRRTT
jgi:type II secretory pathway pseudopilin PulG